MKIGEVLRVDYDDTALDIMDKINAALEEHGLKFEDDELPHDGFELFALRKIERALEAASGPRFDAAFDWGLECALWNVYDGRRTVETVLLYLTSCTRSCWDDPLFFEGLEVAS